MLSAVFLGRFFAIIITKKIVVGVKGVIMMSLDKNIEYRLQLIKPILQEKYNVRKIGVFGSFARGEQTGKSDIDILVEFSKPIGLDFVELKNFLEKTLGKKVDLVTVNALKPQLKEVILSEVIYQ
ncbi:nucleotidyltransferase family protein [Caldalkalibacillus uzonensis]|nr:nucleotidyltransferase family protein [Caldalkalibacillus uzonensis]